jgi:hypothetical protein
LQAIQISPHQFFDRKYTNIYQPQRSQTAFIEIQLGNGRLPYQYPKEEKEGLGVPPLGSGYTLQFLVGCTALRLLWDFRCYPSRGYALLSASRSFCVCVLWKICGMGLFYTYMVVGAGFWLVAAEIMIRSRGD